MKKAFLGRVKLYGPEEAVGKPKQADKSKRNQAITNPAFVDVQDLTWVEALNKDTYRLTVRLIWD